MNNATKSNFDTSYYTPPSVIRHETILSNGTKIERRDTALSDGIIIQPSLNPNRQIELQTYKSGRTMPMITASSQGNDDNFNCVCVVMSDLDLLQLKLEIERYFDARDLDL